MSGQALEWVVFQHLRMTLHRLETRIVASITTGLLQLECRWAIHAGGLANYDL